MGYLGNFIVYALAMVGVIVVALLVFKNATSGGNFGHKSKYLKVIDSMSLGQRKNLYIVSTGKEQFLIAGDVDKTTLISKIEDVDGVSSVNCKTTFQETITNIQRPIQHSKKDVGIWTSMLDKVNR